MAKRTDKSRDAGGTWRQRPDERRRMKDARSLLKRDRQQRRSVAVTSPDDVRDALTGIGSDATASQIAKALGSDDPRNVAGVLRRMVEQGQMLETRPGRYQLSGTGGEYAATLTAGADGAVLASIDDDREIVVHPAHTCGAKAGDVVQLLLGEDSKGIVTRILRRSGREVVGTVNFRPAGPVLVCDNRREGQLPVRSAFPKFNSTYRAGDRVVGTVEVDADGEAGVHLCRILGPASPEIADLRFVSLAHDLPDQFPLEVEAEAAAFTNDFPVGKREDLRNELIITIDPATAKDFDDAISLHTDAGGRTVVGVHIADVSHFVREGTAINAEAVARGTSIYLVNRVIPMLPEQLSNGLCSLVPHQDRYCLTAFLTLAPDGRLVDIRCCESVIHSKQRFTYEEVQSIITGKAKKGQWPKAHTDLILACHRVSQQLRGNRDKAGALNLFSVEHRFTLDVDGNPTEVSREASDESHQLIEELMLLANRGVAQWLAKGGLSLPCRVHAEPDSERMAQFATALDSYGIDAHGVHERFGLQKVLRRLEQEPPAARLVLNFLCLRAFSKAIYQVDNIGHFALAFEHYCHFTSPIRRYPDLIVHRLVKHLLGLKDYRGTEIRRGYIDGLSRQASWLEQRAALAERDIQARKAARYLSQRIGEVFPAVVTGASPMGLYLQLIETGMDGLLPLRLLGDDFYDYDAERLAVVGRRSGRVIGVGAECDVEIDAVDIERAEVSLGFPEGGGFKAAPRKAADAGANRTQTDATAKSPGARPSATASPRPSLLTASKSFGDGKGDGKGDAKNDGKSGGKKGSISAWLDKKAAEREAKKPRAKQGLLPSKPSKKPKSRGR